MNQLNKLIQLFPAFDIPEKYFSYSDQYINKTVNGCGDKMTKYLVPDSLLGLCLEPACTIHDLDYQEIIDKLIGVQIGHKNARALCCIANDRFRRNMLILVQQKYLENKKGCWSIFFWKSEVQQAKIRRKEHLFIIRKYYEAVKKHGWDSLEKSYNREYSEKVKAALNEV